MFVLAVEPRRVSILVQRLIGTSRALFILVLQASLDWLKLDLGT